jgi:prolyl oligopeptidase
LETTDRYFWLLTDSDAPRGRVVAVDTSDVGSPARTLIPESDSTLVQAKAAGDVFIANYLANAHTRIKILSRDGKFIRDLALPGIGTVNGFSGRPGDPECFFDFTGFTRPSTIYRYDVATGQLSEYFAPDLTFNPEQFVTRQVFYSSKDGTSVSMFIVHKKGSFSMGILPPNFMAMVDSAFRSLPRFHRHGSHGWKMGGVFAAPNIRGGGEYGEEWHLAGTRERKQNVFDDFIAAGEWLIENGYTSRSKLAIKGGSNGGLLVGACMNQRPDLFGAAVPAVGVMDMLRFHKFTIGWSWVSDYGSPDNPEDFKVLLAYSPYHNIKSGVVYPATLITTADHDDRVVPGHSYKYAAALQAAQGGSAPILIRIDVRAGHGFGKTGFKAD